MIKPEAVLRGLRGSQTEGLAQHGLICDVQTITPDDAARWLKSNTHNRRIRQAHVAFLAREIRAGQWKLNGQAIVISDDESILDGQHRLLAVIEAGVPIKTLVIYGITFEAFKTIDTGAVRTGADAIALWHPDCTRGDSKAVASAVRWCKRIESKFSGMICKLSNTDVLEYVTAHKSMWRHVEVLDGYPHAARPCSLSFGVALYEMGARKSEDMAEQFMRRLFTGEELHAKDPEYVVRSLLIKDAARTAHYPQDVKMKMLVKAWNMRRRGREANTINSVSLRADDPDKLELI